MVDVLVDNLLTAACGGASGAFCAVLTRQLLKDPPVPCACECRFAQPENQVHLNVTLAIFAGIVLFLLGVLCGALVNRSPEKPAGRARAEQGVPGKGSWGLSLNY